MVPSNAITTTGNEPPTRRWLTTVTVLMGTVSVVLTTTIVNVAIPSIMAAFDMSQMQAHWLSTGFLAAVTATMLLSAGLMARYGQRRVYMAGVVIFVAGSLLGALSWNAGSMIAARIIQGAMAGIIQPLAMVVIFQVFPDNERGKAMGLYGMGVVLAPALGPTVGGILLDWFGWRSVYLAALPFCIAALLLAARFLPVYRPGREDPFDWPGLALLAAGLFLLLGAVSRLPSQGLEGWVLWGISGSLALLAGFVWRELYTAYPLVALHVFRHGEFSAAALVALVYGAGLFASTYLLPLLVQGVQGLSPTLTGLVLMPAGLALALVFPFAGRLSDRLPARRLILAGLALFAGAQVLLAFTKPVTGFWLLAGFILIGRVGLGVAMPALNLGALRRLPDDLVQQGSGVINFSRMLGGALGVNTLALLLQTRALGYLADTGFRRADLHVFYEPGARTSVISPAELEAFTQGFRDSFLTLAVIFVLAMIPAWAMGVMYKRRRRK